MKLLPLLALLTVTVQPGTSWTNLDGVHVRAHPGSPAGVSLTPSIGWAGSKSRVDFAPGSIGIANGLDFTDRAWVRAGARARITGEPEEITLEAGCVCWVNNPGELVQMPGFPPFIVGNVVRINLPNGAQSSVPPGTSWTFTP